uniref:trimethyllysine dioxygenase n=1 Tax=Albugo laibachii Nc14 TaxID=890382 RepID=F0WYT6_9STRA|nr:unnamed protein product [Albugo laibachii Nc14]|eukprot:CCA26645.1 unnamed protein product [Albugo laibachii Nc14]
MVFIKSVLRHTFSTRARNRFAVGCRWVSHAQPASIHLKNVFHSAQSDAIEVEWIDGLRALFLKKWLRENCTCANCLHVETKQRFIETASICDDSPMTICSIKKDDPSVLQIKWQDRVDHAVCTQSQFQASWLRQHAANVISGAKVDDKSDKCLWDHTFQIPTHSFSTSMCDIKPVMMDLYRYGLVMITDTPCSMDETERFARKIGSVMETIYGTMWTTRPETKEQEYNDTASTNKALLHHTDGSYMRDPPGLQIFNCIAQASRGGESLYVDAFHVASVLKALDPQAFDFLSNVPIRFHYLDEKWHQEAVRPIVQVDYTGKMEAFRFNDYDRAPQTHLSLAQLREFYRHHRTLLSLLRAPFFEKVIRLSVGNMVLVDNHRVLHARKAFTEGERAMIGCYIERNLYESRLRLLGIL